MKTTKNRSSMSLNRDETKRRIIEAAEQLFAERGFRHTTVQAITKHAYCNGAAVSYYFGGKETLYLTVFQRRACALRHRLIRSVERLFAERGKAVTLEILLQEILDALLQSLLQGSQDRPLDSVIAWESLEHNVPLAVYERDLSNPIRTTITDAIRTVCPWLSGGQAALCVESIIAQLHWILMAQIQPRRLTPDRTQPNVRERIQHVVAFSAAGTKQYGN